MEDKSPPSRFALACATLLHALTCAVIALYISTRLTMPPPPSPGLRVFLLALAVATALYAFTTYRLWCLRRWAWRVCWIPIVASLIVGLLALIGMLLNGKGLGTAGWVGFAVIVTPAMLLVPLQWRVRRDWANLARLRVAPEEVSKFLAE